MSRIEHRQHHRRRAVGLGLIGGAAAVAALAMLATSPAARADNVASVPVLPVGDGVQNPLVDFGLPGLLSYSSYEQDASYTDLLGYEHDTAGEDIPTWYSFAFGNFTNTLFIDDNTSLEHFFWPTPPGGIDPEITLIEVGGSAFNHFSTGFLGIDNYFAITPVTDVVGDALTYSVNNTWVFDPDGSGIDFGIQYLYLPYDDVNELNILGQGGDILFSIPLGWDLFT